MADRIAHILKERRMELGPTQIQVAMESGIDLRQYQPFEEDIKHIIERVINNAQDASADYAKEKDNFENALLIMKIWIRSEMN